MASVTQRRSLTRNDSPRANKQFGVCPPSGDIKPKGKLAEVLEPFTSWNIATELGEERDTILYYAEFYDPEEALLFKLTWTDQ